MAAKTDDPQIFAEDLSVKKRRPTAGTATTDVVDPIRRLILATGEFYGGVAMAIAEAFRAFNAELEPHHVDTTGLTCSFIDGLAEGNASFYERIADTSRRMVEQRKTDRDPRTRIIVESINYERLAKLVAAELMRSEPGLSSPLDQPPKL
jgi:hypothetical protein